MKCPTIQRRIGHIRLQRLERTGPMQLCRLVLTARNKIAPIGTKLQIRNRLRMHPRNRIERLPRRAIPLRQRPVLVARNNHMPIRPEPRHRRLAVM